MIRILDSAISNYSPVENVRQMTRILAIILIYKYQGFELDAVVHNVDFCLINYPKNPEKNVEGSLQTPNTNKIVD